MILKRVLGFHEPASENGLQSDGEITGGSSEESLAYEDSSSENSSSGDSEETDYPKSRAIIIVGEY